MSNWTNVTAVLYVKNCDSRLKTGAQVLEDFINKYKYLIPKGSEDTVNIKVVADRAITGAICRDLVDDYEYTFGNAAIVIFGALRDTLAKKEVARGFNKFARQLRKEYGITMGSFTAQDSFNTVSIRIINDKFESLSGSDWYEDLSPEEIQALDPLPF